MVDISIIIPCYNSGEFLMEAIQSVETYQGEYKYEIIIVDDGSTDKKTLQIINQLDNTKYKILRQVNRGLSAARNCGCKNAKAECLLFLDSDNKIYHEYIDKGVFNLISDKILGVVYGNPTICGDGSRPGFTSGPFDIRKLMAFNYIDACAVVRKEAWESVKGFDEERQLMSITDWDFWIRLYKTGWHFLFLEQAMYSYRIRANSMASIAEDNFQAKLLLYKKHADLVSELYFQLYTSLELKKKDLNWSIRYRIKQLISKFKRA